MPTKDELRILQAMPLDMKVRRTQQRIREWVNYYGVNGVYVSFSGGKDSTVLLHLVRELYPNVEAVFVNTGLEYPEIQKFAKSFDNVTVLTPKMSFKDVIIKYGYPFISKQVAHFVRYYKKGSEWAKLSYDGKHNQTGEHNDYIQEHYGKWKGLCHLDFNISNVCCGIMKETPLIDYKRKTNKNSFIATITEESTFREKAWLKTGCNAFDSKEPMSKPLSFWTNQNILQYIKAHGLPIASVYGNIVYGDKEQQYETLLCDCGSKLCTTGCDRTGCIFCGFGAHLDKGESRFQRLKRTHPRQYEYCMGGGAYDTDGLWKPTQAGVGMAHCIDELNKLYGKNFIRY